MKKKKKKKSQLSLEISITFAVGHQAAGIRSTSSPVNQSKSDSAGFPRTWILIVIVLQATSPALNM